MHRNTLFCGFNVMCCAYMQLFLAFEIELCIALRGMIELEDDA
nr:hypothetical protein [Paenalcaligenes hominis]